jgi:ribosomal-protein-alanine N-acetyltransferase
MTTLPPDTTGLSSRPMHMRDLAQVSALDALCQPHPWGPANFQGELLRGASGFAQVLTDPQGALVGYVCAWTVLDELHIGNIGVDPHWRRKGLARELMGDAHAWARGCGATLAHLEVRAANDAAIALYERLGYRRVGVRRGYYADNGEDAFLLVCDL